MSTPGQELASIDFESMIGGPLLAVVNAQTQAAMATVSFIKAVGFESVTDEQDPKQQKVGKPVYVTFKYPKETAAFDPGALGEVVSINITKGGSGYDPANPPKVTIDPSPSGSPSPETATATATVDSSGKVASITVTKKGTGYTDSPKPKVTIDPPPAPTPPATTAGAQAEAEATIVPKRDPKPAEFQEMQLEVPILTMLPIPFIRVESTTIDFNAKINSVEYMKTDETFKLGTQASGKYEYPFVASVKMKVSTSFKKNTSAGTNVERTYSMAVNVRAVQDEIPAGMERILGILEDAIKAQPTKAPTPKEV